MRLGWMDWGDIKIPRAHLGRFLHDEYVCYDMMRFRSRSRGGKDFGGRSECYTLTLEDKKGEWF